MAIKTILLRKKISEAKNGIDALKKSREEIETRRADIATRESEIVAAIEEINENSTEEERKAVEESADAIEKEIAAVEADATETDAKIADLEKEVEEMERDLSEIEKQQERTVPPLPAAEDPAKTKKKSGGKKSMLKCRSLRNMTIAERTELVERDDTQKMLAEIRALITNKRGLVGGAYTISDTIVGLIREDIMEYSKLYKHCRVISLSGKGREIVMGTSPEAFWEECCDPIYELEQALTQVEIDCYKVAGFVPLCNAMIEDSDIDLLDEIMVSILQAIGLALDKAILYGTGVKMPTGVVTAVNDDDVVKLTNIIKISAADSVGVKLFQSLVKAGGKTANNYARGEKVWTMNDGTYTTLLSESLSINASGAIVAGIDGRFPVGGGVIEVLNFIPNDNIITGYFDLYVLGERKGMTIDTSEHVRFIQDQTVIRGRARYDGKPAIVKAFAVIGINNTDPATEITFADPSQD